MCPLVQWLRLWGRVSRHRPISAKCRASNRGVILRLCLGNGIQLRPTSAQLCSAERLPLRRGWPGYACLHIGFVQPANYHVHYPCSSKMQIWLWIWSVVLCVWQNLTGCGTRAAGQQPRCWAVRTGRWTSTPITAVAQQPSGAPRNSRKDNTSGKSKWPHRSMAQTWYGTVGYLRINSLWLFIYLIKECCYFWRGVF